MQTPYTRKKTGAILRRLFLFGGVPLLAFSLTIILLYVFMSPEDALPPSVVTNNIPVVVQAVKVGVPSRLSIAGIDVNTEVIPVGLASNGDMDIKENPDEVAWYQHGPRPGDVGSAVIAGHYGWKANQASVFTQLHTVQVGEKVSIYDDGGGEITFVVREIRTYDPEGDATEVFRSSDGKAHLNLITCDGAWNDTQQTYSTRLVVFTDRVTQ